MENFEDEIINEVQAHPILYARDHNEYKKTSKRENAWKEIAASMESDVDTVKKRWRSLRDSFIKHFRAFNNIPTAQLNKKKIWQYFDSMMFLAPHIEIRENSSFSDVQDNSSIDKSDKSEDVEDFDEGSETIENFNTDFDAKTNPSSSRTKSTTGSKKRKLFDDVDKKIIEILENEDDADKRFLLSLLPNLKRLPPQKNSLAKIKIQQILYDVEFAYHCSHSSSTDGV